MKIVKDKEIIPISPKSAGRVGMRPGSLAYALNALEVGESVVISTAASNVASSWARLKPKRFISRRVGPENPSAGRRVWRIE